MPATITRSYRIILAASAIIIGSVLSASAVDAEPTKQKCAPDRDAMLAELDAKYEETHEAIGLSSDGGVIEVLTSPDGSFTMVITFAGKPTCVLAVGKGWTSLAHLKGPQA